MVCTLLLLLGHNLHAESKIMALQHRHGHTHSIHVHDKFISPSESEVCQVKIDILLTSKHYAGITLFGEEVMEEIPFSSIRSSLNYGLSAEEVFSCSHKIVEWMSRVLPAGNHLLCPLIARKIGRDVVRLLRMEVAEECQAKTNIRLQVHVQVESDHFFEEEMALTPNPASKAAIEALEKGRFEADDPLSHCLVCLSEFSGGEEFTRMPCKHMFHPDCIIPWLEIKNSCPTCRSRIN